MHELILHYDKPLIRQAVRALWWRVVGFRFVAATALLAIILVVSLLHGDRSWFVGSLATVLAVGIAFIVALYVVNYRRAIRKLTAMGEPRATLSVSEASLTVTSGAGSATLPWSAVTELWRFESFWLLLFSKAQFATVPLANMTPECADFILARVRDAGGKVA
jgi:hypothetical protein